MVQNGGRRVQSIDTSCTIVATLRESGGSGVSELAEKLDLAPGTVHTHLATLKDHGHVIQDGKTYKLGPQFLMLGEHFRNNNALYQSAKEQVEELAKKTGASVHLITEHDGRVLVLYEVFGDEAIGMEYHARKREEPLGHLHCTASGKAILSQYDRERVESIVDQHGMTRKTPNTITELEALFAELEATNERGYAISNEEQTVGLSAVGAPILHADGRVGGAISVSGPAKRLGDVDVEEHLAEAVIRATNIAEVNLNSQ